MRASILIRTKDEARLLETCLDAIFAQEDVTAEVLVLDSGSKDGTLEIARRFPVRLMTIAPEAFTYGYALNVGFGAASYPHLVAVSGHSVPVHRRWLWSLLRHFEDPGVMGVSGPEVNRWSPHCPGRCVRLTEETFFGDPRFGFSNFNAAVRRAAWERLPFHEGLAYGEDKEWAWQMVRQGGGIVVDGAAAVYHEHQESLRQLWHRGRREALGQSAWRGARSYSMRTVLRGGLLGALDHVRRGRWEVGGLAGPLAYYHGRYTGFAEGRRAPVEPGPRLLDRPRGIHPLPV